MLTNRRQFIISGCALFVLAACGPSTPPATPTPQPKPRVNLAIGSKGEEMAYDKTTLEVPAGTRVVLTLDNPSVGMQHNWVLTLPGQADAVAADGLAKSNEAQGYLVPGDKRVLAFTKLLKPKEKAVVEFDAPAPGSYPYICTFPGHATLMKGVLIVK